MMLFTRNFFRKADGCFCWHKKKKYSVEAPKTNEQCKLQSSTPTTLTLNISEETPIMCCSQNTTGSDPPAHMSHPLPALKQESKTENWPPVVLYAIINVVPLRRWKEFLRLLSVADQQLERVELEAGFGLGFTEKQYQMLKLWSQRSSASFREVFSVLHCMDLSGCAQMLQENLDKILWKHKSKQILLSYQDITDCELSEIVQDTKGGTSGI
ncbi:tumor necrosis factor receptor superfamily member 25 [Gouania willdenowi]|uniref:tumor necrosis factor receptor superfamily member 25 n=1 Tax=Gouania willdenowi TaxID=441366 RepID=UPI0010559CF1|nr:tumor necrosis factor receptor superfamily member 25-like [Gouania willdenowi]